MYACPVCHVPLNKGICPTCYYQPEWHEGIPFFFTSSETSKQYRAICDFYDRLYSETEGDTWERIADRGSEFDSFVAGLVDRSSPRRYLDVGCGEGRLIRAVSAKEKYGIDLSYRALRKLGDSDGAEVCVGFAEQLPYETGFFSVVSSIGVMTHFLDDLVASKEIHRVLAPGGHYILGVYVRPGRIAESAARLRNALRSGQGMGSLGLRVVAKIGRLWESKSFAVQPERKDKQPVERHYEPKLLLDILERSGFGLEELITKLRRPDAPLAGQHFRIYILKKQVGG